MVRIQPFEVEEWMNEYEQTPNNLNIAETCAASVSLDELVSLSAAKEPADPLQSSVKLTYGPIRGSLALRERIASVCSSFGEAIGSPLGPEDVLVTPGAIHANFLTLYTLIEPGDHVICIYPTYQQLYSVPKSLGADVTLWKLKAEQRFIPDPQELGSMVRENTKVWIDNPCFCQINGRLI
jgi:aspartate/methionine/tyrosine aminotransferase